MPKKNGNGPAAKPAVLVATSRREITAAIKDCVPVFAVNIGDALKCADGIWECPDGQLLLMEGLNSNCPQLTGVLPAQAFQWVATHDHLHDLGGEMDARTRFLGQIARILVMK